MRTVGVAGLAALLVACASPAPAPDPTPRVAIAQPSELTRSLLELGELALSRGELALAESRFRRALASQAGSAEALRGLARVALARGDAAGARDMLEEAVATSPDPVAALILLAQLDRRADRRGAARASLERALALDPDRYDAASELASLTGPAPSARPASRAEALARARDHPYDPRAQLEAGRAQAVVGDVESARRHLEAAVWQADRDPSAGLAAARALRKLLPDWASREIVRVHVVADETVRRETDWRMRMRWMLRSASETLAPVLDVAFVPVTVSEAETAGAGLLLDDIDRAFRASQPARHGPGLVLAVTERSPPRRPGGWQLGKAEFLGLRTIVRVAPGSVTSRVLIHEILHLYGGVHVAAGVESLMNPSGLSLTLDPLNRRVASLVRKRRFGPGGPSANVVPHSDVTRLTRAYVDMLKLNLHLRSLGIEEAVEAKKSSRYLARRHARKAVRLDRHLADVARFVALLHAQQGRDAEAAHLYDISANLYGDDSPRGKETRERADRLRERLAAP